MPAVGFAGCGCACVLKLRGSGGGGGGGGVMHFVGLVQVFNLLFHHPSITVHDVCVCVCLFVCMCVVTVI